MVDFRGTTAPTEAVLQFCGRAQAFCPLLRGPWNRHQAVLKPLGWICSAGRQDRLLLSNDFYPAKGGRRPCF